MAHLAQFRYFSDLPLDLLTKITKVFEKLLLSKETSISVTAVRTGDKFSVTVLDIEYLVEVIDWIYILAIEDGPYFELKVSERRLHGS